MSAVAALYRTEIARQAPGKQCLTSALKEMTPGRPPDLPLTRTLKPAQAHLPAIYLAAKVEESRTSALVAHFAEAESELSWTQNPNYSADNLGAHYMENYAYSDLIGPRGRFSSTSVAVGFLLLGPGLVYPDHSHPAEEVYHVAAGGAEFRAGGGPWAYRQAGALIHHAPQVSHAMRVGSLPLLALYCWCGDLATAARLDS